MAVCEWCHQEMLDGVSCTVTEFHLDGVPVPLPPYRDRHRCHDCGVPPGGYHHIGCDWADCPSCGGKMFSCYCRFDEDPPDTDFVDDDDDDDFGPSADGLRIVLRGPWTPSDRPHGLAG